MHPCVCVCVCLCRGNNRTTVLRSDFSLYYQQDFMGLICSFLILKRINDNPVMTDAFNARTTLNLTFLISIIFYLSVNIFNIVHSVLVFLSQ